MRNMIRNKKMSGLEKVNTGLKSSSKCSRSPVFAHNSPLVACKKVLKNFFPRYLKKGEIFIKLSDKYLSLDQKPKFLKETRLRLM